MPLQNSFSSIAPWQKRQKRYHRTFHESDSVTLRALLFGPSCGGSLSSLPPARAYYVRKLSLEACRGTAPARPVCLPDAYLTAKPLAISPAMGIRQKFPDTAVLPSIDLFGADGRVDGRTGRPREQNYGASNPEKLCRRCRARPRRSHLPFASGGPRSAPARGLTHHFTLTVSQSAL